jgi:hypothetical protein
MSKEEAAVKLADELERIALDMEQATAHGMSWISHSECDEFVARIRRAALTRPQREAGEVEGLVEKLLAMGPRPGDGGEARHNRQVYADAADALTSQAAELSTLKRSVEEAREQVAKDATRFEVCANMIGQGFGADGSQRAEHVVKARHFAAEALAFLHTPEDRLKE